MPRQPFTLTRSVLVPVLGGLVGTGLLLAVPVPSAAQSSPRPRPEAGNPSAPVTTPAEREAQRLRGQDLESLRAEQRKAQETAARLKHEIEAIGDDRRKLNQQLTDTAGRIRAVEDQVAQTQDRLKPLDERERALRQALDARRDVMAEVLAALQRIGHHPPPALMVTAQDALQSVRSAIMLGAVLPELRQEADLLVGDLAELVRVRRQIADGKEQLTRELAGLSEAQIRLGLLIEQRQKQQAQTEQALDTEHQRATQLGRQAETLMDLITKLEQGPTRNGRASSDKDRADLAALGDPGRLAPAIAFAGAKGKLPLPVNGTRIKEFGAPDGLGGIQKGLSVAARPGAQVTSPCDGWVVYAGPFRNYGQLLILNAGTGYHVLLAGMDRISVDLGQFVVTGEPVAVMGGGSEAAAALAEGAGHPVLYVEFRKDGTPVDPSPWWATQDGEKVRG
jgi:murein hydrolase activator